jgi:hypothetical protein
MRHLATQKVWTAANDEDRIRAYAAELVGLAPDVIVSSGGAATAAMGQKRLTCSTVGCLFSPGADMVGT